MQKSLLSDSTRHRNKRYPSFKFRKVGIKMKRKNSLIIGAAAIAIVAIAVFALIFGYIANKPTAQAGPVFAGSTLYDSYYDPGATTSKSLSDMYGLSFAQAESLLNNKPEWKAYSFQIEVKNKSKEPMSVIAFEVKKNGKDDIWLQTAPDEKIEILAGNTNTISVTALVMQSLSQEVPDETAMQRIKKFDIKIVYSKIPSTTPDGRESIETSKTIRVK